MRTLERLGPALTCLVVAALAGLASAIAILARGDGAHALVTSARGEAYEMTTTGVYAWNAQRVVAEGVGWDVITLVVAVPLLVLLVPLVARGSVRGRLAAAGVLGYVVYQELEYAVTWAFGPLFPLFVGLLAVAVVGLGWIAWTLVAEAPAVRLAGGHFPRRGWASLALGMSALLILMWAGRIAAGLTGAPELLGETTMTVQALDLGLVVPILGLSGLLALRRSRAGEFLAAAVGVTFVLMAVAITAMLVSAAVAEGVAEVVPIAVFGLAAAAGLVLAARIYGPAPVEIALAAPAPAPAAERGADAAPEPVVGRPELTEPARA